MSSFKLGLLLSFPLLVNLMADSNQFSKRINSQRISYYTNCISCILGFCVMRLFQQILAILSANYSFQSVDL